MAFVNSTNTLEEINAARMDNADYEASGSVEKAKNFFVACEVYLVKHADAVRNGEVSAEEDYRKIRESITEAKKWWRANDTTASAPVYAGGTRLLGVSRGGWRT